MTNRDRDFAMEAALAAEGDHIWREWPKGRLTQSRIFRLANTLRPIIEAAQAAVRPEVAKKDEELVYRISERKYSVEFDDESCDRCGDNGPALTTEEAIAEVAAYRESWKCPKCGGGE